MNDCTHCNGQGIVMIDVFWDGVKSAAAVVCPVCDGYSDHEEVMK